MSEMPRDFDPETGGLILFVGGPRGATYIRIPPLMNTLKVSEFNPKLRASRLERLEDLNEPIVDHVYNLDSLWYGRSKTKWWIMLYETIRNKEPDLPRILAAERRALSKILPPVESCAVPMKPGPLSGKQNYDDFKAQFLNAHQKCPKKGLSGIKIPNPWKFSGGFGSV